LRPQFVAVSGVDVQGTHFNLASLKGPVTLIYFWSPSNAASRKELEMVERLYQRYFKRGLNAIGVSTDGRVEPVRAVMNDITVSWPQYADQSGIAKKQGVASVPRLYVLNPSLEIVGVGRASDLQGVIAELMRPSSKSKAAL
jgi:thiol-disulfide isomerase/thioredoxin